MELTALLPAFIGAFLGYALAAVLDAARRARAARKEAESTFAVHGHGDGHEVVLHDDEGHVVGTLIRPADDDDPVEWRCGIADCTYADGQTAPTPPDAVFAAIRQYHETHRA